MCQNGESYMIQRRSISWTEMEIMPWYTFTLNASMVLILICAGVYIMDRNIFSDMILSVLLILGGVVQAILLILFRRMNIDNEDMWETRIDRDGDEMVERLVSLFSDHSITFKKLGKSALKRYNPKYVAEIFQIRNGEATLSVIKGKDNHPISWLIIGPARDDWKDDIFQIQSLIKDEFSIEQ